VFGIGATNKYDPNYKRDQWLVGLVNCAPYAASALWCASTLSTPIDVGG
jgi:hypothetical protein